MIKLSIMPFIQSLDKISKSKLIEYITATFARTHANATNNPVETDDTLSADYMISDYQNDCIGFLNRNEDILYLAIDDYNCDITDKYFAEKMGTPPIVNASMVKSIIEQISNTAPITILYNIQRKKRFHLACRDLPSDRFRHLTIENILYEIIIETFNDRECAEWKVFFDDEQKNPEVVCTKKIVAKPCVKK
jgi:hypothetical protein